MYWLSNCYIFLYHIHLCFWIQCDLHYPIVTIFVKPPENPDKTVEIPQENDFVDIKNVMCVRMPTGNFKLLSHFYKDQVQVLRKEFSTVKDIITRLENLTTTNQVCTRDFIFFFSKCSIDNSLCKFINHCYDWIDFRSKYCSNQWFNWDDKFEVVNCLRFCASCPK